MATYLEKEIAIIERLDATGYEAFDGSRDQALDFVEKHLGAGNEAARLRSAGLEHRFEDALNAAAAAIDALDRISAALGLEPFAGVDTSDPEAVAGVAADFASEMFRAGTRGEA